MSKLLWCVLGGAAIVVGVGIVSALLDDDAESKRVSDEGGDQGAIESQDDSETPEPTAL